MNKPFLLIECPAASASGYGAKTRGILYGLFKLDKFDIKIVDTVWGSCPRNAIDEDNDLNNKIRANLFTEPTLNRQPDIFIKVGLPNEIRRIGKFNILITSLVETNVCSAQWIESGNQNSDLIIVPSNFSKEVLTKTSFDRLDNNTKQVIGVIQNNRPVEVLFEGLDTDIFKKVTKISGNIKSELSNIKEDFAFLFTGHWLPGKLGQDRKDIGMLIKTFLETFKNNKKAPALVLKSSMGTFSIMDRETILKKINKIKESVTAKSLPNIYLLHGELSDEEINTLYQHPKIKAYVSFTKGEGFGRPQLEFASTGKPLITSNWSGYLDFLDPNHNILLPGEITQVHPSVVWKDVILKEAQWFTVNYVYASQILKDVYSNYDKHLTRSRKQGHQIKKKYSLDKMTEELGKILDKYLGDMPQQVTPNLPKLKKKEPAKMQLPKLKKV